MHASSSLVNGCHNFKRETLTKHLQSKSHIYGRDCYFAHSGKSKTVTQQKALPGAFARQETPQRKDLQRELEIKCNAAYAIAKEELLFTKYRPLLLLHKKNGVNISPTYDNDDKCAEFISHEYPHVEKIKNLRKQNFKGEANNKQLEDTQGSDFSS